MLIGLFCKYTLLAQPERKNEPLRVCENAACLLSCAVKGHCSHTLCFNANEKAVNYVLQFTKSLKHLNSYFTEVGFLKWWFVFAQVGREESDFWLDGCMDEWGGLSTLDSSHSSHVFVFEFSTTWSANPRLYWVGYISYPPPGGSKLFFFSTGWCWQALNWSCDGNKSNVCFSFLWFYLPVHCSLGYLLDITLNAVTKIFSSVEAVKCFYCAKKINRSGNIHAVVS